MYHSKHSGHLGLLSNFTHASLLSCHTSCTDLAVGSRKLERDRPPKCKQTLPWVNVRKKTASFLRDRGGARLRHQNRLARAWRTHLQARQSSSLSGWSRLELRSSCRSSRSMPSSSSIARCCASASRSKSCRRTSAAAAAF